MPVIDGNTFECEKCGELCCIDADGLRSAAYCYTCHDYAKGFDGSAWFMEIAWGEADARRKAAREQEK